MTLSKAKKHTSCHKYPFYWLQYAFSLFLVSKFKREKGNHQQAKE